MTSPFVIKYAGLYVKSDGPWIDLVMDEADATRFDDEDYAGLVIDRTHLNPAMCKMVRVEEMEK